MLDNGVARDNCPHPRNAPSSHQGGGPREPLAGGVGGRWMMGPKGCMGGVGSVAVQEARWSPPPAVLPLQYLRPPSPR